MPRHVIEHVVYIYETPQHLRLQSPEELQGGPCASSTVCWVCNWWDGTVHGSGSSQCGRDLGRDQTPERSTATRTTALVWVELSLLTLPSIVCLEMLGGVECEFF